ncbi:DNA-binding response regulator [Thalassotalea insulae]|uniref:DNA-binding response regulator n=1 Tax=Thalassotalea insulae TaxID=2056778 RepID=A0ABQ6H093_9GAMM|nr:response regulator transcription factor [Thalassotalea insulae]GLX80296.1 DNA-binding response regulator [Thalassotalea insulae]
MSVNTILMIDDDVELTELVSQYLQTNGFEVHYSHHGRDIDTLIATHQPDVIVLDLMLPDIDGLTICKSIRADFSGAIIMLTALGDDIDEVTGLEVGADDYLAKPVKPRVLLAHIRAQLRRQSQLQLTHQETSIWCCHDTVKLDTGSRSVESHGQEVILSSAEFDLLVLLAKHAGNTVTRESLHEQIFRLPYDGIDRSIDLRISRIRKKLGDDPKLPSLIKTVRNVGYLLAR